MNAARPGSVAAPLDQGPSLLTRVAAVAVALALAGLAYYAVFAGPTTVAVNTPAKVAPAKVAPAHGEPATEGREGNRGD